MKKKRLYVEFKIVQHSEKERGARVKIYVDDLRRYLHIAEKEKMDGVEIKTKVNHNDFSIQLSIDQIKKLIKTAEFSRIVIPRNLSFSSELPNLLAWTCS